jgi:stress response protein YsnF
MQTVISAFDDRQTAQRAVERLVDMGFDRADVHLQEAPADDAARTRVGDLTMDSAEREVAADRGVFASIGDFFSNLFGDDDRRSNYAGTYSEAVRRGSSVVVVDAQDEEQAERAASLMHELGAMDVDERARQWRASGWTGGYDEEPRLRGASDADDDVRAGREGVMDVVEEELQVGKRSIDKGGVRVVQRVSQKPVREIVKLREERATVERRAVDRPATAEDLSNFREGAIEVREMAEEPVVSKTARVVEEVRVGKDVQEREQTVEDNLRRNDVDVERMEGKADSRNLERERAVASDLPRDVPGQDSEVEAREAKVQRSKKKDT